MLFAVKRKTIVKNLTHYISENAKYDKINVNNYLCLAIAGTYFNVTVVI